MFNKDTKSSERKNAKPLLKHRQDKPPYFST
jgi:hypothetical protein